MQMPNAHVANGGAARRNGERVSPTRSEAKGQRSAVIFGTKLWGNPLRRARAEPSAGTEDMVYTQDRRQGLQICEEWIFTEGVTQEDAFRPWKESRVVDQRLQFSLNYQKEENLLTGLRHESGISRPSARPGLRP